MCWFFLLRGEQAANPCIIYVLAFRFYFTSLQLVLRRVADVERLPVLHHDADYIFISFGIIGLVVVSLKMEFCLCIR